MINVSNLNKEFKTKEGRLTAVRDISFDVIKGEIFGFLGPNGAGKTTTINMLCTLLKPTKGSALLNGFDIVKESYKVRESIGLVFQDPSLDEKLTAKENMEFHALLYNVPYRLREERIKNMLRMVDLEQRKDHIVSSFSGGMKRRLEIARGLLHFPRVLFLDEPTLGLDPQTRNHIWDYINRMRREEEITIFLTTHYMEEAENCDRIAIIDHGDIITLDTPLRLKKGIGGDVITLNSDDNEMAKSYVKSKYGINPKDNNDHGIYFEVVNGEEFLPSFIKEASFKINQVSLRYPTLEDVFLNLTGRRIRESSADGHDLLRAHARIRRR